MHFQNVAPGADALAALRGLDPAGLVAEGIDTDLVIGRPEHPEDADVGFIGAARLHVLGRKPVIARDAPRGLDQVGEGPGAVEHGIGVV